MVNNLSKQNKEKLKMKKQEQSKTLGFLRRNAVYLVLALCVLALGIATTFVLINNANERAGELNNNNPSIEIPEDGTPVEKPDDNLEPSEPVEKPDDGNQPSQPVVEPISFIMPVASTTSVQDYSSTMVFNSTLNRYTAHLAIDFFAPEGTDVVAVYGGTVKSVETTLLKGVTVTIDHGDGLITVYNSLADGDSVTVGQSVNKGDVIGQVSTTNRQEYKAGAHLHFEVMENGELIDPVKYLVFEEK